MIYIWRICFIPIIDELKLACPVILLDFALFVMSLSAMLRLKRKNDVYVMHASQMALWQVQKVKPTKAHDVQL